MKSKLDKYTKEELQSILNRASSLREVLLNAGLSASGNGSYNVLKRRIKLFDLSLESLKENKKIKLKEMMQSWIKRKRSDEEVFQKDIYITTTNLRRRIIVSKLMNYRCSECGVQDTYNGKNISLQLHHIDGDNTNNSLSNLTFLCPNCHSQTKNYGSKKLTGRRKV